MKKALSFVVLLSLCLVLCVSVALAGSGSSFNNAFDMTAGESYNYTWTYYNTMLTHYTRITVPQRGYINYFVEKDRGTYGYTMTLYNAAGEKIWGSNTPSSWSAPSYPYHIGLDAGTYVMSIKPRYKFNSSSGKQSMLYSYSFNATEYSEIEPNNSMASATPIGMNKIYSGVMCEETPGVFPDEYDPADYYKVAFVKGHKYHICIYDYEALSAADVEIEMKRYGADYTYTPFSFTKDTGYYYFEVEAAATADYFLYIHTHTGNRAGVDYKVRVYDTSATKSIKLDKTKYTANLQSVKQLQLKATIDKNSKSKVTWSSSDTNVAKVNGSGLVTFTGVGSATITASTDNSLSAKCEIKVTGPSVKFKKVKSTSAGAVSVTIKGGTNMLKYQVSYCPAGTESWKDVTVKTAGTAMPSKVITKLLSHENYDFRVRGQFKGANGKKYYTAWSNIKTVTVK